jgi:hypothetical protein
LCLFSITSYFLLQDLIPVCSERDKARETFVTKVQHLLQMELTSAQSLRELVDLCEKLRGMLQQLPASCFSDVRGDGASTFAAAVKSFEEWQEKMRSVPSQLVKMTEDSAMALNACITAGLVSHDPPHQAAPNVLHSHEALRAALDAELAWLPPTEDFPKAALIEAVSHVSAVIEKRLQQAQSLRTRTTDHRVQHNDLSGIVTNWQADTEPLVKAKKEVKAKRKAHAYLIFQREHPDDTPPTDAEVDAARDELQAACFVLNEQVQRLVSRRVHIDTFCTGFLGEKRFD